MSDLIKREKVIATIGVMYERCDGDITDYRDLMLESVRVLPSADRPSGEWIKLYGDSRFMCSICKCLENVPTCMGKPSVWDYCPNCGARMKGADDE